MTVKEGQEAQDNQDQAQDQSQQDDRQDQEGQQSDSSTVIDAAGQDGQQDQSGSQDSELVDENGVSWKNRAREMERKYFESLERRAQAPEKPAEKDEFTLATEQVAERVLTERQQLENKAEMVMGSTLDRLQQQLPQMGPMRATVERDLRLLDPKLRANPDVVQNVFMLAFGRMMAVAAKKAPPQAGRLVGKPGSDVMAPSGKGSSPEPVKLSAAEEKFAEQHRLYEKGFDNQEIRDYCAKRNKK